VQMSYELQINFGGSRVEVSALRGKQPQGIEKQKQALGSSIRVRRKVIYFFEYSKPPAIVKLCQ